MFGHFVTNSEGKKISTRTIAEFHIKQDCDGVIPRVDMWIKALINKEKHSWINTPREKDLEYLKNL